jgi:putative flippase GtrA
VSVVSEVGAPRVGVVSGSAATGTVEVVVPVYNEERALAGCVRTLRSYLEANLPVPWSITVVDNASTDRTAEVAASLAERYPGVNVLRLDRKGRGLALREAWLRSTADVVAYMDVDLSTGLDALFPLIAPLLTGHSDIAVGTRLAPGSRVIRGARREIVSRAYNSIIKLSHGARFSDAQCGFKAMRTDVARALLPHVRDDSWFFDTELLLLAEHNGLRIHEVPVDWMEDVDSRVDVVSTATDDLRGLVRVARAKADHSARVPGLPQRPEVAPIHPNAVIAPPSSTRWQVGCFALIGLVSTALTAVLYLLLRGTFEPLAANLIALVTSTLLNTEANRRLTFLGAGRGHGRGAVGRMHLQGLVVFGVYYAFTSGALLLLDALLPGAGTGVEVAALLLASAVGTLGRFALLRRWVFAGTRAA